MSSWLPLGNSAHTVFISCQMFVLIIMSFPVVPPPRQQRPPSLSPLAPRFTPGGSDSLFPLLSHPTIFSFSHCSTYSWFSHLVAAPTSSTPSSLYWLAHLGKVKGKLQEVQSCPCSYDIGGFTNLQNITSHKCHFRLQSSCNSTGDHISGMVSGSICQIISTINPLKLKYLYEVWPSGQEFGWNCGHNQAPDERSISF